jgi:hypothetical protein
LHLFAIGRPHHRNARRRVAEKIFELGECISGVERNEGRAELQAREIQGERLGRLFDLRDDPIAGRDLQRRQRPSQAARERRHVGIAQAAALVGFEQRALWIVSGDGFQPP